MQLSVAQRGEGAVPIAKIQIVSMSTVKMYLPWLVLHLLEICMVFFDCGSKLLFISVIPDEGSSPGVLTQHYQSHTDHCQV
jgi:hypothetical protein